MPLSTPGGSRDPRAPITAAQAYEWVSQPRDAAALDALCAAAAARRDALFGDTLSFSPKVFLPTTNLCRNRCDYCTFRRSPGDEGAHTMRFEEVAREIAAGAAIGCTEALLCLGDSPEKAFASYRRDLAEMGVSSTVEHLLRSSEIALELGMFPHTNAGILDRDALVALRPLNASMGLMLENSSPRLCERGMPHHRAPDKRPEVRIAMLKTAGELAIPFTSGILIGIGETREERVASLLVLRDLHETYGHLQEIIVQNFRAKPSTRMEAAEEPGADALREAIALARLILPDDVNVQAPPNLSPGSVAMLVDAGVNDFGGVSPLTPDYINPERPWPHLAQLREDVVACGRTLAPRLPIYPPWLNATWVDARLLPRLRAAQAELPTWWRRYGDALAAPPLPFEESPL